MRKPRSLLIFAPGRAHGHSRAIPAVLCASLGLEWMLQGAHFATASLASGSGRQMALANEYGQYSNEERTSELLIKRRKNRVNIRIAPEHISQDRAPLCIRMNGVPQCGHSCQITHRDMNITTGLPVLRK